MALRSRFRLLRDDSEIVSLRLALLQKPLSRRKARDLAKLIVREMKDDISKGINPITFGSRRFPRYKNPDRYPGGRKGRRPVNLKLTGKFLKSLLARSTAGRRGSAFAEVGFSDGLSQKKEQGHREGANTQPKRPIIPEGREKFNARIMDIIVNYIDRIASDISRKRRPKR